MLDFSDSEFRVQDVKIGDKEYTLEEASGDAKCVYQNAMTKGVTLNSDGKPEKISSLADADPLLLSHCLFDNTGKHVSVMFVRGLPDRIMEALVTEVKKMSNMLDTKDGEKDAADLAKNEQESKESGSD